MPQDRELMMSESSTDTFRGDGAILSGGSDMFPPSFSPGPTGGGRPSVGNFQPPMLKKQGTKKGGLTSRNLASIASATSDQSFDIRSNISSGTMRLGLNTLGSGSPGGTKQPFTFSRIGSGIGGVMKAGATAVKRKTTLNMLNMKSLQERMLKQDKSNWSPLRRYINTVVESKVFSSGILAVILINTMMTAVQTYDSMTMRYGWYIDALDEFFMGVYIFELTMKIFAQRSMYLKSGWNAFDFFIVFISIFESVSVLAVKSLSSSSFNPTIFRVLRLFKVFKAMRALRVLRTISFLKNLQVIVSTLLKSIPAMANIIILLAMVLYIFAIIGINLYKDLLPDRFGTLPIAIFSLFQLITLDNWFQFYDDAQSADGNSVAATTIYYYMLIFIILENFIFINLFIAVIVNNLEQADSKKKRKQGKTKSEKKNDFKDTEDKKKDDFQLGNKPEEGWEEGDNIPAGKHKKDSEIGSVDLDLHYSENNLPTWERNIMADFFMLVAALDNNMDSYSQIQSTLDELVVLSRLDVTESAVTVRKEEPH